jgi:hypothetical protein
VVGVEKQPAEADTDASCHITDKAGQGHSGAVTAPAANHSKAGPSTSGVTSPVKVQLQQVLEDLIARQYAEGPCSQQLPATDGSHVNQQVHGVPGATQAASSLAGAGRPRRSFLYTSPLHHDVMSVKVKVPRTVVTSQQHTWCRHPLWQSERPFTHICCGTYQRPPPVAHLWDPTMPSLHTAGPPPHSQPHGHLRCPDTVSPHAPGCGDTRPAGTHVERMGQRLCADVCMGHPTQTKPPSQHIKAIYTCF